VEWVAGGFSFLGTLSAGGEIGDFFHHLKGGFFFLIFHFFLTYLTSRREGTWEFHLSQLAPKTMMIKLLVWSNTLMMKPKKKHQRPRYLNDGSTKAKVLLTAFLV